MKNKIAVFTGDMFWSSTPYVALDVLNAISNRYDVDLIMFDQDIRLNKVFSGYEKFYFDANKFKENPNLKTIKSWQDFKILSKDYLLILCSTKLYPKTRFPNFFKSHNKSSIFQKMLYWDVSGADQLTDVLNLHEKNRQKNKKNILVKGKKWKDYICKIEKYHNIKIAGSPQYDPHMKNYRGLHESLSNYRFCKKYSLKEKTKKILVAPHNPGSHKKQFDQNLQNLELLLNAIKKDNKDYEVLVKTYPHDYMFYENDKSYSGVYKRYYNNTEPQYEFLKRKFPELKIIDSHDHFSALKNSDLLFNISGSSIAWETYWTNCQSFSMNYKDEPYCGGVPYLPEHILYPDMYFNTEITDMSQAFSKISNQKEEGRNFLTTSLFSSNIVNIIKNMIEV